jgi:hypothetical protein
MSFHTAFAYQRLMTIAYPSTVLKAFSEWASDNCPAEHPIWPRLRGESRFCRLIFEPDIQARTSEKRFDQEEKGNRYTMINYCYIRNNTVECRLLPMMDSPKKAWEAIQVLLETTNKFLLATAKREKKIEAISTLDSTPTIKEITACV